MKAVQIPVPDNLGLLYTTKEGPVFDSVENTKFVRELILAGDYFERRSEGMAEDIDKATDNIDRHLRVLDERVQLVIRREKEFGEQAKGVSTRARNAIADLGKANDKIRNSFDLESLGKMCDALERTADALERMAKLDKSGDLARVIDAFKRGAA